MDENTFLLYFKGNSDECYKFTTEETKSLRGGWSVTLMKYYNEV